jgi:prepilin-type N-terminal cleavage/methylation domain-containing protein/prepilin-type processing-associated H-X9-DG protein
MPRERNAFTLIELLVVIAIIAIVAGILFPVFAQARIKGQTIACLSNTKQMGYAVMMYAQDFDETIVPWIQPTGLPRDSVRSDRRSWVHLLAPYVKNGDPPRIPNLPPNANVDALGVWRCPSFNVAEFIKNTNSPDCFGPDTIDASMLARQYYAHYGIISPPPAGGAGSCTREDPYYNYTGSDPLDSGKTGTLAEVTRPAETALITDGATVMSNLPNWAIFSAGGCVAATSHQGGGNHVFLDGHAKWIRGNSERYELQDQQGCWYKRYYTIDK